MSRPGGQTAADLGLAVDKYLFHDYILALFPAGEMK